MLSNDNVEKQRVLRKTLQDVAAKFIQWEQGVSSAGVTNELKRITDGRGRRGERGGGQSGRGGRKLRLKPSGNASSRPRRLH